MATFTKTAVLLALALTAGSVFAAAKPSTQTISTLGGKFTFSLPKAYVADTLPAGKAEDGTGDTQGTLYANQSTKSVVIVAETVRKDGVKIEDNDPKFLDGAVAGFIKDQSAALPDFKKQSEKKLNFKGLGMRQVDSTATQGGGKTLNSTFLGGSGNQLLVIQAISRADDVKGHAELVKQITGK
ncbi:MULTISPECIES: hypothetical protein [Pseudomonas]|uniref:hypothetical protein n=1 Tax=Pseudomonas TaxID=286 RepID=UPI001AE53916|nr:MULTISPECIES: hypothetical protein [unclassified Pseudomonas]WQG58102.1 hypothetical protein RHM66_25615 [Pseudomonas sp. RTB3]MBP1124109.1 hypothetical protein [Pseudomonas sp. PvP025]MDQ0397969.1 hypothetical protein [Pseudomonas sp. PvP006]MEB0108138.1 hypothetical protein [Pseudomonas sp. MH9.3]WPX79816.1 hypothetical protein RHM60_01465 [Pseudomonas sp. MH9.3]